MPTIITFLNDKGLKADAVYRWGDQVYSGGVFCLALREFVPHDRMLVCNTPEAEKITWPYIAALNDPRIEPVSIPKGKSTAELWDLFDKIAARIHEDETVVFDITHGLRSLPFLVFLFAAYLKSAKRVKIEAIYYGALELADFKNGKPAPVIDLSEFVTMLDWLTAVNQFLYTGNARYLAAQLRNQSQADLLPLAENVSEIALGLELLRPRDIVKASNMLPAHLKAVQGGLPKPFGVIVQPLEQAYAQFGIAPTNDATQHLQSQLRMINWYLEKQYFVHALSMAREWMVSLLCVNFEEDLWDKDARDDMELLLNGGVRKSADGKNVVKAKHLAEWNVYPHRKEVAHLWQGEGYNLANLRNDVLHSGFRKNPQPAQEIIERSGRIVQKINEIARLWSLT